MAGREFIPALSLLSGEREAGQDAQDGEEKGTNLTQDESSRKLRRGRAWGDVIRMPAFLIAK